MPMSVINEIDVDALQDSIDTLRTNPTLARATFAVDGSWQGGYRITTRTGALSQGGERDATRVAKFEMTSDEPVAALGTDTAPTPAEYVLHALAGCYTVTITAHAALRGIELKGIRLELEVDLDMRGFLGIDASVRPGLQQIRIGVDLDAPNTTRKQLEELIALVERRSTIRDTLVNPVDVVTTLT
ncbi:OsmC family protein [Streptomyces sp. NPDC091376]|uniref:OsmC family protein n=1 Tax=Streptomyces sp. NPDC091376 TaxID=3365994 RepID=UPI0038048B4D